MAKFCLVMKMTPNDYRSLTMREYRAFIGAWNEMNEVAE
jgi:hypothetical protein